MTMHSLQLLKQLEPAVRPAGPMSYGAKPQAALETQSFDQLLARARRGEIHSGRQIELAFEPAEPLHASQLERLAEAADQAESAGMSRALMVIDGRAFVLDVKNRTLSAEVPIGSENLVQQIDGAVFVGNKVGDPHQVKWPAGIDASPPNLKHTFTPLK